MHVRRWALPALGAFRGQLRRCTVAPPAPAAAAEHKDDATRGTILKDTWRVGAPSVVEASEDAAPQKKGWREMFRKTQERRAGVLLSHSNVDWARHERLDFFIEWMAPASWPVSSRVGENTVSIRATPPPPTTPAPSSGVNDSQQRAAAAAAGLHGLSVTAFAYHTPVPAKASDDALLRSFLQQFDKSVGRSSRVLGTSAATDEQIVANAVPVGLCREVAATAGGAVAEITFRPPHMPPGSGAAHGLCRVFFHTTRKRHTVTLFVVPEAEWSHVRDLVAFSVCSVREMGGDQSDK